MRLSEIAMNIQDIIALPVINNLPQQRQHQAPLNAQIAGLVIALRRFGLNVVADWIADKMQDATDPGTTVPDYVLAKIPQQDESPSDFARQAMAARVIANKLGLYDAADYLKKLL